MKLSMLELIKNIIKIISKGILICLIEHIIAKMNQNIKVLNTIEVQYTFGKVSLGILKRFRKS